MTKKLKTLLICVAIPLIVGGLSGFISRGSMATFEQLNKPPLLPPDWIFPLVWTVLFVLMGVASYLVLTSGANHKVIKNALTAYALQLIVNFFWSIFFFNMEWYLFSFVWLLLLWILVLITTALFYSIIKPAAYLMIPYFLWIIFAGYLNFSIYLLNK